MKTIIKKADDYLGTTAFYPEMKESRPQADGEIQNSYDGKHVYIDTPLSLKTNRSIKFVKTYVQSELTTSRKVGWNSYTVTKKGYKELKKQYSFSRESLLD